MGGRMSRPEPYAVTLAVTKLRPLRVGPSSEELVSARASTSAKESLLLPLPLAILGHAEALGQLPEGSLAFLRVASLPNSIEVRFLHL